MSGPPRLILPASVFARRVVGECYVCGDPVYEGNEAHMGRCAQRHLDELRQEEKERREPLAIFHEPHDPEIEAHMRRVGETMKREGRLVVKPNERAGFS